MKKYVIGSLVGAILVFAWQFLSWSMLGIHDAASKYHPAQDSIINMLSSTITEEGTYMLPTTPPGSDMKAEEELMKTMKGKPFATITYKKSWDDNMARPMITGFVIDFILVILLISILTRGGLPTFIGIFTGSIAVALF